MEVTTKQYKSCDLIKLSGKLDHNTSQNFEEELHKITDANRNYIAVDMSDLEYMSSEGIRVLLDATAKCRRSGGDVVLAMVPQRILETLDIAALAKHFKIYDDLLEAVGGGQI